MVYTRLGFRSQGSRFFRDFNGVYGLGFLIVLLNMVVVLSVLGLVCVSLVMHIHIEKPLIKPL